MIVRKLIVLALISVVLLSIPSATSSATVIQDGTISGTIWEDSNQNGILEIAEVGIDNVTVYVQDQTTNAVYTTLTENGGGFVFQDLTPGTYSVWYEQGGTTADAIETELDELNGFANVNFGIDSSIMQASIVHMIYLPLIQGP